MQQVVGEEDVDEAVVPGEADLTVSHRRLRIDGDIDTQRPQRRGDLGPALRADEDVDVDVARRARRGVEAEGDGPADRVGEAGGVEGRVDRQDPLRQRRGAVAPGLDDLAGHLIEGT